MLQLKKDQIIQSKHISSLLTNHYVDITAAFYEMHSSLLSAINKKYKNLESACILLAFVSKVQQEILRQREKNLDFDISLNGFFSNVNKIGRISHKISTIVEDTGVPKETVRRKINKLASEKIIYKNSEKKYHWDLEKAQQESFIKEINYEINILSIFISKFSKILNLNFKIDEVKKELKDNFSFYWFHFLNCRLKWLKMWKSNLKDLDLILIMIQAFIPTLQNTNQKLKEKRINVDDLHLIIGQSADKSKNNHFSISATSISEIAKIPRATCSRKLEKLVKLGLFVKESKTIRYYINQITTARTKNVLTKENVSNTIVIFSDFVATVINTLNRKR